MAKKNDKAFDDFLADIVSLNPAVEEILKDDKVKTKLKEGVLARADYSAHMDNLRDRESQFASEVQEARSKIDGWKNWYGTATQQVASIQSKLAKYEDTYGALEDADPRHVARRTGLTQEEVAQLLDKKTQERDLVAMKFADDLTDIKIDFSTRFKSKLDTEAIYKVAGERGVDLKTAYDIHIADRVEELRNKDVEDRIAKAKEDAVAEFASKHNFPTIDTRSEMTHVLDAKEIPNTSRDRVQAALAGFLQKR